MATRTEPALCLRRSDYGEYDAVVTFLSRDSGRVALSARGVNRPRAHNAAACQRFVLSRIQIASGKGMHVLAQASVEDSFYELREELWRSAWATYVCELADRALPEDEPHPEAFDLLLFTLDGLRRAMRGAALVHSFELRLMALLGYEPELSRSVRSGADLTGDVHFSPAAGGTLLAGERGPRERTFPLTPRLLAALRRLADPAAYGQDLVATAIPPDLDDALWPVVRGFLDYHLDTQLKSARFIEQLRAQGMPEGDEG